MQMAARVNSSFKNGEEPLFDDVPLEDALPKPMPPDSKLSELVSAIPRTIRLGTSSWAFPGWRGIVYSASSGSRRLAQEGLAAYSANPLLRTVGLDRNFYRPLTRRQFEAFAKQVPEDFRFLVKAPRNITDPYVRAENGRAKGQNPHFLNAELAASHFLRPAVMGLGEKTGPLVFQFSPFQRSVMRQETERTRIVEAIARFFAELQDLNPSGRLLCAEFRNYELVTPRMLTQLRSLGVVYVMGIHPTMPGVRRQIEAVKFYETGNRTLEGDWQIRHPVVIRWSLAAHQFFDVARRHWAPFDRIQSPDPVTRSLLASVLVRAARSDCESYMVANNKAEGCAPITMRSVAEHVFEQWRPSSSRR